MDVDDGGRKLGAGRDYIVEFRVLLRRRGQPTRRGSCRDVAIAAIVN